MKRKRKRWALIALIGLLLAAGCTILIPPVGREEVKKADIDVEVEISSVNPLGYINWSREVNTETKYPSYSGW